MKVHELLARPEAWTKGAVARDASGIEVDFNSPSACQWCLMGAVVKCYPGEVRSNLWRLGAARNGAIQDWNDLPSRTHAEVLALVTELDI